MVVDWSHPFWSRVHPEALSGCWLWHGTDYQRAGKNDVRGRYKFPPAQGGAYDLAHRAAWKIAVGPIPDGAVVCHRCDVPLCVNPDHLWLGTPRQNNADRNRKGRARWAKQSLLHEVANLLEGWRLTSV